MGGLCKISSELTGVHSPTLPVTAHVPFLALSSHKDLEQPVGEVNTPLQLSLHCGSSGSCHIGLSVGVLLLADLYLFSSIIFTHSNIRA